MSSRLAGKIAIVTGASSGVGRAIALSFAREEASVVCADLRPEARPEASGESDICTDEAIRESGGQSIFIKTDVSSADEFEALVNEAVQAFGRLDILVNNAGIAMEASRPPMKAHETPEAMWDTTMAVNSKSVFLGSKYAAAQMLRQEPQSTGHRGWIVNISSAFGIVAGHHNPCYSASKAAVVNLTRQVAVDYGPDKITSNVICPGYTQTAIFAEAVKNLVDYDDLVSRHPAGLGVPQDLAGAAVFLASDDARWVTGATLSVDGGYTAR